MYKTIERSPFNYGIEDFDPALEEDNGVYSNRPPVFTPAASKHAKCKQTHTTGFYVDIYGKKHTTNNPLTL